MRSYVCLILLTAVTGYIAQAQQKTLQSIKAPGAPRMDGLLDDPAWKEAPEAADFITNSPVFGRPATVKTTVKVVYDNGALYIGAYIHSESKNIRRQFTSRDNQNRADVDYFAVFIDTYT